jgi:hypothetical protein
MMEDKNGRGNLSIFCHRFNFFYINGDEDIHADRGMDEE